MQRGVTLATGETYHVYNRGAHKSFVFEDDEDYRRFLLLMFLANDKSPIDTRSIKLRYKGRSFAEIFIEESVSKELVDILAYTLMPNHFHFILRQRCEKGITNFMQRLCTAYSMYFNVKYEHSGVLFQGRFQNKYVLDNSYYRWLFSYVHLNPLSLINPNWEIEGISTPETARAFMRAYEYSSYYDYFVDFRRERIILAYSEVPPYLLKQNDIEDLLRNYTKARPLHKNNAQF